MVVIIAECGVNWRNLAEADLMIRDCADAGADICKFQAYEDYQVASHPRDKELFDIRLKEEDIRYLYWRCCQHKIEFMCTPMYDDAVIILDPYVKRWKIREKDNHNWGLVGDCLDTHKEILLSSQELLTIPSPLKRIKQLYCIPEYPPKKGHDIVNNYKGFAGASCHYPVIDIALDFVKLGAEYLEVHVKRDYYPPGDYCPVDNAVSITISELRELVNRIREQE